MGPEGDGAVVARQLGKVCLVGCSELAIDMAARRATSQAASLRSATGCASTATAGGCCRQTRARDLSTDGVAAAGGKAGRGARAASFPLTPTNSRKRSFSARTSRQGEHDRSIDSPCGVLSRLPAAPFVAISISVLLAYRTAGRPVFEYATRVRNGSAVAMVVPTFPALYRLEPCGAVTSQAIPLRLATC
jgi:hypothetical protein